VIDLKNRARRLRRQQTDAERELWSRLRGREVGGAKFRRQHAIGRYVVDFCCPERRLVVEVDGGQHLVKEEYDLQRTALLLRRGYRMLRFWDNDVLLNADVVMEEIARVVEDPHPNPLLRRERVKISVRPR